MKKTYKKSLVILMVLVCCTLIGGCGCGKKKKPDDASTKVMQITITPEPTPTAAPEQISSEAVLKNGNLTMVNLYLAQNKDIPEEASGDAAGETNDTETEGKEDGSEE